MKDDITFDVYFDVTERTHDLTTPIFACVANELRRGPATKEKVFDVLDALAVVAAAVIGGSGPEAFDFFKAQVTRHLSTVVDAADAADPPPPGVLQ